MYQYGNGFKGYNDLAGSDFARTIDTVMEAQRPPTVKKRDCCYGDLCNGDGLASSTDDNQCRTFDFLNPFFEDDDQPTHCKSDQTKCLTIVGQKRDTLESIPYQYVTLESRPANTKRTLGCAGRLTSIAAPRNSSTATESF